MRYKKRKRDKRWGEEWHVRIGVGFTVLLIAGLIYVFGVVYPPQGGFAAAVVR